MEKHLYLNESDTISKDLVKLALNLPESALGKRAKNELISSATNTASFFKIGCYEASAEESVEKFNRVLENAGISKFWLEFVRDEGITQKSTVDHLIDSIGDLISHTIHIRSTEEHKLKSESSFAGEWLLDD